MHHPWRGISSSVTTRSAQHFWRINLCQKHCTHCNATLARRPGYIYFRIVWGWERGWSPQWWTPLTCFRFAWHKIMKNSSLNLLNNKILHSEIQDLYFVEGRQQNNRQSTVKVNNCSSPPDVCSRVFSKYKKCLYCIIWWYNITGE